MTTTWSWRKSTRSATNGQCVEIGTRADETTVGVRDSKLGDASAILLFPARAFAAFTGTHQHKSDNRG
ncbi:DUF397 domain-containing protein [Actinosynnema sp. NPDC047251]|uniref:DUF397 domain-containing protein n=1 Tax=Saccharothrix espanaensis (strain ATCC 51144 / DSM 44229 / JCM 9112 / NBRC 15066 / NRRL 15764) TaxID=1179773 RepID=K0K630_SACES|nr:DUF397 domain-containing protein [Saccharothrix espanaensis]CCH35725.1 hypothetical protein BN6_85110 [Saccharothrix espanaensis DSM 44229]